MPKTIKDIIALWLGRLSLACAGVAALGMVSIVIIIVASVLIRKFGSSPLHITEEVVGLLLSVSLFLGLPMVTLKAKHVRVTLLSDLMKGKWNLAMQVAALLFGICFFGWLILESIPWFEFAFQRNIKTETTRILLYPWMAIMPLSLTLTCSIFIARLVGIIHRDGDEIRD